MLHYQSQPSNEQRFSGWAGMAILLAMAGGPVSLLLLMFVPERMRIVTFAPQVMAFAVAIIALVQIRCSRGQIEGMDAALLGIVIAGTSLCAPISFWAMFSGPLLTGL